MYENISKKVGLGSNWGDFDRTGGGVGVMGKDIPRSCWIGARQGKAREGGKKAKAEARHRPC